MTALNQPGPACSAAPGALASVTSVLHAAAAASAARAWVSEWMTISRRTYRNLLLAQFADQRGGFDHAIGEAPFVVVPAQHAHEALVDDLGLGQIKARAVRIVEEIARYDFVLHHGDDAAEAVRIRRFLHQAVDLVAAGVAAGGEFEIDQRDIGRRHADRRSVELAVE